MRDYQPRRAAVLARISDARNGDEAGVDRQVADARELGTGNGWAIGPAATHIVVENDTSAYHRRKVCRNCLKPSRDCTCRDQHETVLRTWRPEFRRLLQMLKTGEADGLLAYDLDRIARDPRDLEDLIDVVEQRRVPVLAKGGRLKNADDLTMARIMCAIAHKSSGDTARRVARKRQDKALRGEYGGGRRPYGWGAPTGDVTPDGRPVLDMSKAVESEAAEVRRWAEQILAGVSLRTITADLRARGVPTLKGGEWDSGSVRDILLKPRNAGLVVYQVREAAREYRERGEPVPYDCGVVPGAIGQWEPILTEGTWRSVGLLLSDPARRTSPGNTPRWLGSLIYKCGPCAERGVTETVVANGAVNGRGPSYCCRQGGMGHLRRAVARVDEWVVDVIIARLAEPDAAGLITPQPPGPDRAALSREANALRERKASILALVADGTFTAAEARTQAGPISERLAEIDAALTRTVTRSPLDALPLGTDQVRAVWERLPLGSQRAIVRLLVDVTLMHGKPGRQPGGGYFDTDSVVITWKS